MVAVVQILSGDSENYGVTVYKSKVLTAFKGAVAGQQLFFGPFISLGVGSEYLAFLQRAKTGPTLQFRDSPNLNYGQLENFHLIMYEGYSIMPIRYVCAFEGKDRREACDYGVRVNTFQVRLPASIKAFPRRADEDDFVPANQWVRKNQLLRLMSALK